MTRRRALLLLIIAAACGDVRLDPSPSCSYRNDRAAIPDSGNMPSGEPSNVRAGQRHACAMSNDRDARCWGANDLGQLSQNFDPAPGESWDYDDWRGTAIPSAGGAHTCVFNDDEVACWGNNELGQLGDGTTQPRAGVVSVALEVEPLHALAAGLVHTCVTNVTDVFCWGDNRYGQLGRATSDDCCHAPARVEGLPDGVIALSAGAFHTCALVEVDAVRQLYCWGDDRYGALGDGPDEGLRGVPVRALLDEPVGTVAAGPHHTCAGVLGGLDEGVSIFCWGRNESGELGSAGGLFDPFPRGVTAPEIFVGLVAGGSAGLERDGTGTLVPTDGEGTTCALTDDSHAYCWGANRSGQIAGAPLGVVSRPTPLENRYRWESLAIGGDFGCGVTHSEIIIDGEIPARLYCWGENDHGQLGRPGDASLVPMTTDIFIDPD